MARRVGITTHDVIDAAADEADRRGFEHLTLAALAGRLGVRSPSLYAHVDGLPGVRRLLTLRAAELMQRELEGAVGDRHGTAALRALCSAYRAFALRHPGLYAAAQQAVPPGGDTEVYDALLAVVQPVVRALQEAGAAEADTIHLTRSLRSALHGFVLLESAGGFGLPESVETSFTRMVDLLAAGVVAGRDSG